MDLSRDPKLNRPGLSLAALEDIGVPALQNSQESDLSFSSFLRKLMVAAGINHNVQVNDCETAADWVESDNGTFDKACAATGKRVGTNCLSLTNTAATDGTQYIETLLINESAYAQKDPVGLSGNRQANWNDSKYLGFWVHAESGGDFGTAGEAKVALIYDGGQVSTKVNIQATVGTVHQFQSIALSEFGIPLDKIEKIRFYGDNLNAAEVLYIDDIQRYEIEYNGAPYYGAAFPIKASTTLANGDSAKWTIDGLIKSVSSAAVTDLGPVLLDDASVTGDGARSKWGMIPGVTIGIARANAATTPGDMLQWVSNGVYTDVTTTATGKGSMIALEAAGAQYDDIMVLFFKNSTSA
jgi:hypothetical protein